MEGTKERDGWVRVLLECGDVRIPLDRKNVPVLG